MNQNKCHINAGSELEVSRSSIKMAVVEPR